MPDPGSVQPVNPDAEAARLAAERKRATKAEALNCRHCGGLERLTRTPEGWECEDRPGCVKRQGGEPGNG